MSSNADQISANTVMPFGEISRRISVPEIARRLSIGRQTVYTMLEQSIIPGIRLGQRWLITRHAYEEWERTGGSCARSETGRRADTELRS